MRSVPVISSNAENAFCNTSRSAAFWGDATSSPCKKCPHYEFLEKNGADLCIDKHDECPLKIETLVYGDKSSCVDESKECAFCGKTFYRPANHTKWQWERQKCCCISCGQKYKSNGVYERDKKILALRATGMPWDDICKKMKITIGQARGAYYRARKRGEIE